MARVIAAILTLASAACLYFALTQPILTSRMITLTQMIEVLYPMEAYQQTIPAGQPAATPDGYRTAIKNYETLIGNFVLKTDAAKANLAALTQPTSYTAWESSRLLWNAGDRLSSIAIVAFSIVYPVVKTLLVLLMIALNFKNQTVVRLAEFTHKYTMLDVFVAALTLVALSTQQFIEIKTGPAVGWYVGYLTLGFAALGALIWHHTRRAAPAA